MTHEATYSRTRNSRDVLCADCDRRGWFTVVRHDGSGKTTACKIHVASVVHELSKPSPMRPGALVRVLGERQEAIIRDVRWSPTDTVPWALIGYPDGLVRRIAISHLASVAGM